MEGKIGRNDPCPCGSGKKYKRCCLGKHAPLPYDSFTEYFKSVTQDLIEKERVDASDEFSKYNSVELMCTVSLLQVLPENHGNNIRLEEIQRQALKRCRVHEVDNKVGIESFEKYIHDKFPHNHREDPPENLFTQNIMTPMGNRILFPGIAEGQVFSLQYFIQVLMREEFTFPGEFRAKTLEPVFLLLNLSHAIATGFEYERNLTLRKLESNDIYFPSEDLINERKGLFAYSLNEIMSLKPSQAFDIGLLDELILNPSDKKLDTDNPNENPIVYKPLVKVGDLIIVVSPCTISFAAVNFIIKQAQKHQCLAELIYGYSSIGWSRIRYMLRDMGFLQIDFELPEIGKLPILEGMFVFDTDKFAYVLMKFDDGAGYDPERPLQTFNDGFEADLKERRKQVYKLIKNAGQFKGCRFLHLTIILGLGRPGYVTFETDNPAWEVLGFSIDDLDILFRSDKCTNLTLWNFSRALNSRPLMTTFFLDNISFFISNDESLYTSDDKVDNLIVAVGNCHDLVVNSITKYDEHLEKYPGEKLLLIQVRREPLPALLPVYSTRDLPILPFRVCCSSFDRPIWIRPLIEFKDPENDHEKFDAEICIAIGYWLNELSISLKPKFAMRDVTPIVLVIQAKPISNIRESFNNIDNTEPLESKILVRINENEIHLTLDEYFFYHLYRNDNHAERVMISVVFGSIGECLTAKKIPHQLDHNTIRRAVEKHAPLGIKKKLLLQVSDYDIRISPHNVKNLRDLQPFQVNEQIDFLASKILGKNYKARNITNSSEKLDILSKVVDHFYGELRRLLAPYDNDDLLRKLISLYESSIQARERSRLETPPSLACFGADDKVGKELLETAKKRSQISLSLRCLIEHAIAEPVPGIKALDSEALDAALALMYNIINWGSISDQIYFEIEDTGISILASGRIGTDKSFEKENMNPFYKAKFEEDIIDFSRVFNNRFSYKEGGERKSIDKDFLDAFESEFELDYSKFSLIVDEAVFACYESEDCYLFIAESDLIAVLANKTDLPNDLISKFLKDFTLRSRGRVENVSEFGYKPKDYFPWRYGRALSLLNRPFLAIEKDNNKFIAFGCRALIDFKYHLVSKIFAGSFQGMSKQMRSFTSQMLNRKGKEFTKDVFELLRRVHSFDVVEREQIIGPKGKIICPIQIGDIDILILDKHKKRVLLLECKNIVTAKTPYEMHLELLKFYENEWFEKADKRDEWLRNNMAALAVYDSTVNFSGFSLQTIFVTNEIVPLPFIRKEIKHRFLTYNDLEFNQGAFS